MVASLLFRHYEECFHTYFACNALKQSKIQSSSSSGGAAGAAVEKIFPGHYEEHSVQYIATK
ncbi:MAG: hypothetical protein ABIH42_06960 [Planctomycetota bacterium]